MTFKFDLQGLISLILMLLAGAAFAYSVKGDVALVQKDITYLQTTIKENKDALTRQIWSVDRKVNEITKTVVK